MGEAGGPVFGEANGFAGGHLDDGEHLAGDGDDGSIRGTTDFEGAPKAEALDAFQPAVNDQMVAEFGRAFVIDFGPDDDGKALGRSHFDQAHAELFGEQGAGDFDEAQIDDIVDDAGAVCVEEHHLDGCFNARSLDGGRLGR